MVLGWAVLLCVAIVEVAVLVLMIREVRKAERVSAYHAALQSLRGDVAALRKEHVALDEIVSAWMNRVATRAKRAKRQEQEEEEQPALPADLFFPGMTPNEPSN